MFLTRPGRVLPTHVKVIVGNDLVLYAGLEYRKVLRFLENRRQTNVIGGVAHEGHSLTSFYLFALLYQNTSGRLGLDHTFCFINT